ncbi:SDR family oxidoreductase [Segetibacter sp. 3557_3]|uniref:SDR family NAD(P)-dependent oxidoreductase n=1 Tax=Segetibacter sp. 3557_3 TaxID=2547429 RepID=UPI0010586491|nr:SDR family oxidoreductase [Segetibacter sp. 3557_3]TDH25240.1 SDR family oxidoreductase [Segetibacter sp. 3557_3]
MENTAATKIGLVTGGSRGLGKDMALRLADHGHDVILTYQTKKEAANEVVRQIQDSGRKAAALPFDAADFGSISTFVEQVKSELSSTWQTNRIDFLINNAGIGATIPFEQVTAHDFDLFLNIHFKSVYFLTQALLPVINDHGRIINISTGTTRVGVPGYSVYASMKSAVETFTRYLAKEIGARGITANVVAPGPVETDFNNGGNRDIPERKKFLASMSALGRVGKPEDIGGVVAFLCSDDAGWINGQRIEVSGGMSL